MLKIEFTDNSIHEWHADNLSRSHIHLRSKKLTPKCHVFSLFASGNELEYIYRHLRLPILLVDPGETMTWFGETANFIYANLPDPKK